MAKTDGWQIHINCKEQDINCPIKSCLGHFFEAATEPEIREWFLQKIGELFHHEQEVLSLPPSERLAVRRQKEEPLIDEIVAKLKTLMHHGKLLPKSKITEAIRYDSASFPTLRLT